MHKADTTLPLDLSAALAAEPEARASFERLSPSHQREYIKWVEEAKKPETRASRILKTIAMLKQEKTKR